FCFFWFRFRLNNTVIEDGTQIRQRKKRGFSSAPRGISDFDQFISEASIKHAALQNRVPKVDPLFSACLFVNSSKPKTCAGPKIKTLGDKRVGYIALRKERNFFRFVSRFNVPSSGSVPIFLSLVFFRLFKIGPCLVQNL